jgi:hypothetical protein
MASRTFAGRNFRSSLHLEKLECRVMLSASPTDYSSVAAYHSQSTTTAHTAEFDLGITGTEVQFSPIGTPSYMAGTISYVNPSGYRTSGIGVYQETLTPIFMDVNGDLVPDFVGTNGVATFTFYLGASHKIALGSITTVNASYIQGITANGEMLVGSTGTITASTGYFRDLCGGFTSQSTVALAPAFAMQTAVHFAISDYCLPPTLGLQIASSVANTLADAWRNDLAAMVHSLEDGARDQRPADKFDKNDAGDHHGILPNSDGDHPFVNRGQSGSQDRFGSKLDRWAEDLAHWRLGNSC